MVIAYGVCVGSWDKFQANVVAHIHNSQPVLALSGQSSIAVAYNSILNAAIAIDAEVLILQHDDLEIVDPDGEAKIVEALSAPGVGAVGVAGGTFGGGIAWWNYAPVGHQRTDNMNIDFGVHSGEVDLLEGSLIALAVRRLHNVHFDTDYVGFHGYDVDISTQLRNLDLKVLVADIDTWHHNSMGFRSPESHQNWNLADQLFQSKWGTRGR